MRRTGHAQVFSGHGDIRREWRPVGSRLAVDVSDCRMVTVKMMYKRIFRLYKQFGQIFSCFPAGMLKKKIRAVQEKRISPLMVQAEIAALSDELEQVMGNVEPQFLELGNRLQQLYGDAEHLARLTMDTVGIIGEEREDGFPGSTDRLARTSLERLQEICEGITRNLEEIGKGSEYLGQLCAICPLIENTGMTLNVIGLNIAVETSRSARAGEMFVSFTDEIRKLSGRILTIARNILEDSLRTRSGQMAAHGTIMKDMEALGRLNRDAEKVVQDAVAEIRQIMHLSGTAFKKSSTWSGDISRLAGEVVVAIQFHDIARQKIEHIVLALRDMEAVSDREEAVFLGNAHKIMRLQAAQLKEVIADIRAADDKSRNAFGKMGDRIVDLLDDVSVFDPDGQDESRIRQHILALHTGFGQLGTLMSRSCELEEQIRATSGSVFETAAHLSSHIDQVRGISMDLHLKALNAVVKSARLGEDGRALEVLAQEVSKLSGQSDLFVDRVVDIIESLLLVSPDHGVCSLQEPVDDGAANDYLIQEGLRRISSVYENFRTDAAAALDHARHLQTDISRTSEDIGFLGELAGNLNVHLERMTALIDRLSPWSDYENDHTDEKLKQVARRYTMKSERDMHLRTTATLPDAMPEEDMMPDVSAPDEETDDWENVDLFMDDEEDAEDGPETDKGDEPEKEDKAPDTEDMGDNVELF